MSIILLWMVVRTGQMPPYQFMFAGAMVSAVCSSVCSIPVCYLLRQKNEQDFAAPLVYFPLLVITGCLIAKFPIGAFIGAHPTLLATAVILHFRLPDYFEGKNVCHACGYDLRGNVSGRCPECGTAIAKIEVSENRRGGT